MSKVLNLDTSEIFERNRLSKARVKINKGGSSSGKTYSILQLLLIKALTQDILISVVSGTLPHLKRGAIRDFNNILESLNVYNEKNINKTDLIYSFRGRIEFFSADDVTKLRGPRRDILFINECDKLTHNQYVQLAMRTKDEIFLDYNPIGDFWINKIINDSDVELIHSTYKDNPYLDNNIIKEIEKLQHQDANLWRVYGLGLDGRIEGLIYPNWNSCDELPDDTKCFYGLDFGYSNDPTALVKVVEYDSQLWIKEMIYEHRLTNQDISNKMIALGINKRDQIFADSAEPKSIEEIRRMGWNIQPSVKGKDSINNGINKVKQHSLNVTKDSMFIIKELNNYKWMEDRDGNDINKPIDSFNHALDALRYAITMKYGGNTGRIKSIGFG